VHASALRIGFSSAAVLRKLAATCRKTKHQIRIQPQSREAKEAKATALDVAVAAGAGAVVALTALRPQAQRMRRSILKGTRRILIWKPVTRPLPLLAQKIPVQRPEHLKSLLRPPVPLLQSPSRLKKVNRNAASRCIANLPAANLHVASHPGANHFPRRFNLHPWRRFTRRSMM